MHFPKLLAASVGLALTAGIPAWAGFTITPIFSAAIAGDTNSANIESTINSAIAVYQTRFTNPVNINITFDEMTSGLGQSQYVYYQIPYATYYAALAAHATSSDDATALAHLSSGTNTNNPVTGTANIFVHAANIIALGIGNADNTQNLIKLNTSITNPGSTGTSGSYSLLSVTEHEIDEILGLSSALDLTTPTNPFPEDLFRYNSSGARSFTTSTSAASFFSIDTSADLAQFNQTATGDTGDWASNPHPAGVPVQVQDAFATPGAAPAPGVELTALDVIGYTNAITAPEPTPAVLLSGMGVVSFLLRRRRRA